MLTAHWFEQGRTHSEGGGGDLSVIVSKSSVNLSSKHKSCYSQVSIPLFF